MSEQRVEDLENRIVVARAVIDRCCLEIDAAYLQSRASIWFEICEKVRIWLAELRMGALK